MDCLHHEFLESNDILDAGAISLDKKNLPSAYLDDEEGYCILNIGDLRISTKTNH